MKNGLQKSLQKKGPAHDANGTLRLPKTGYDPGPGLPDSPPRVRGFLDKKQLSEQETRTGAHFWVHFWAVVLELVISESISGKLLIFWWNLKQKRQVIAELFAYCPFPKANDLTRSGPRPGEFVYLLFVILVHFVP